LSNAEGDRTETQVVFRRGVTKENPSGTSWACPKRRNELKKFDDNDWKITSDYACNPAFDTRHNHPFWKFTDKDKKMYSKEQQKTKKDIMQDNNKFHQCKSLSVCAGTGNVWVVEKPWLTWKGV